jgi:hypothetical protein
VNPRSGRIERRYSTATQMIGGATIRTIADPKREATAHRAPKSARKTACSRISKAHAAVPMMLIQ